MRIADCKLNKYRFAIYYLYKCSVNLIVGFSVNAPPLIYSNTLIIMQTLPSVEINHLYWDSMALSVGIHIY